MATPLPGPTSSALPRFPNFQDFSPTDANFTCIQLCKGQEQKRCSRRVNQRDLCTAVALRSKILQLPFARQDLIQDLERYVELCYCKQSHRSTAVKMYWTRQVAAEWLAQLLPPSTSDSAAERPDPIFPPRFLPYSKVTRGLLSTLAEPLGKHEFEEGTLYMLGRDEDPGIFKVGYTAKTTDDRFSYFVTICGFEPVPVRQIRHVPCIRRVEELVLTELAQYRRECTTCGRQPRCRRLHAEWFEVDQDLAMDVMTKWARWMTQADPYDTNGELKEAWSRGLNIAGAQRLTSTCLREMWDLQQTRLETPEMVDAQQTQLHALEKMLARLKLANKKLLK